MSDFYVYKPKYRKPRMSVPQKNVRQVLIKADFRDEPEKIKLIKDYAQANKKTYSEIMREITDQVVSLIRQEEIEDIK